VFLICIFAVKIADVINRYNHGGVNRFKRYTTLLLEFEKKIRTRMLSEINSIGKPIFHKRVNYVTSAKKKKNHQNRKHSQTSFLFYKIIAYSFFFICLNTRICLSTRFVGKVSFRQFPVGIGSKTKYKEK